MISVKTFCDRWFNPKYNTFHSHKAFFRVSITLYVCVQSVNWKNHSWVFSIRFIKFSKLSVRNEFMCFPGARSPSLAFTGTSQNEGEGGGWGRPALISLELVPVNHMMLLSDWALKELKSFSADSLGNLFFHRLTDTQVFIPVSLSQQDFCANDTTVPTCVCFFPVHVCGPPQDSLTLLWPRLCLFVTLQASGDMTPKDRSAGMRHAIKNQLILIRHECQTPPASCAHSLFFSKWQKYQSVTAEN